MADIRHWVGIAAPQTRVYQAVATREGLSGWWTREVDGDPGVGGTLRPEAFGASRCHVQVMACAIALYMQVSTCT